MTRARTQSASLCVTFAVVVVVLLVFGCDAKGSFGYRRSSAGGYLRSTKRGYYSSRTRYFTTGMYWRSGYSYAGYRGAPARTSAGTLSASQVADVLCKRSVRVDNTTSTSNYGDTVLINSTQRCVKELYAIPGDPGNVPLEDLMLDRIQFKLRLTPYPTVDMRVFPDKDIVIPLLNASLRLRRLIISESPTAVTGSVPDIDLSTITWYPCTLKSCDFSASKSNTFGYPSSRFLDGGRVLSLAVSGTSSSGLRILLRFWLSNDFDEDNGIEHVFLMPSLIKVDVAVAVVDDAAFSFAYGGVTSGNLYLGVEAILSNPESGPSSNIVPVPVNASKLGIEFNPRQMNRIEIGSYIDQQEKKGGLLSWWSATSGEYLCFKPGDPKCVNFLDWSNVTINVACPTGSSTPSYCADLLHPGFVGRSLRWMFQEPLTTNTDAQWYFHVGYSDPFVGLEPDACGGFGVLTVLLLFVSLMTLLTL